MSVPEMCAVAAVSRAREHADQNITYEIEPRDVGDQQRHAGGAALP